MTYGAGVSPSPAPGARDRALFANFLRREITTRYLGSVTGLAWALLNPLALLAVYHFVFTHIFRVGAFAGSGLQQRVRTSTLSYGGAVLLCAFGMWLFAS